MNVALKKFGITVVTIVTAASNGGWWLPIRGCDVDVLSATLPSLSSRLEPEGRETESGARLQIIFPEKSYKLSFLEF